MTDWRRRSLQKDEIVDRYPVITRVLHWTAALLIAAQFVVAWAMPEIERGMQPLGLIAWHVGIGLTILIVAFARFGWRSTHRMPAPPEALSRPLRLLSRSTHYALYALLIILPLLGWANASARGWRFRLTDGIDIPNLVEKGSTLGLAAGDVHKVFSTIFLVVIGLHVAGAMYHALVLHDDTLKRII